MKFAKKTDLIIISAIILVCIIFWGAYKLLYAQTPAVAQIYYKSQLIQTIDLSEGTEKYFSIPQNEHVVFHLFSDGSICFEESNCRDKICVRSGKLNMVGETAACLPNQIILKIVRKDRSSSDDIDIVIGIGR
jgi:hypothetical protein